MTAVTINTVGTANSLPDHLTSFTLERIKMLFTRTLLINSLLVFMLLPVYLSADIKVTNQNKPTKQNKLQKADIVTTASGLHYKVYSVGTGLKPKANDLVTIRYHGTLAGGEIFDSNIDGEPTSFTLNRLLPGLSEGLQTMQEGGRTSFLIPPKLAYGDQAVGKIPANSTLTFQVELLKVVPLNIPTDLASIKSFKVDALKCGKPPVMPNDEEGLKNLQSIIEIFSACTHRYYTKVVGQLEALADMGQKTTDETMRTIILKKIEASEKYMESELEPATDFLKRYQELRASES